MPREVTRLVARVALLSLPLVAALALYLHYDPFRVVRPHDAYYLPGERVLLNRDFVSTETYLRNRARLSYDSFIFGNSRSLAFLCADWAPYLGGAAQPFHFDAYLESLYGIAAKVRFVARQAPLRHALIVLDPGVLAVTANSEGHLYMKHPAVSGESRLRFQAASFTAFVGNLFFVKFLDHRWTGRSRPYMEDVLQDWEARQLPDTNDLVFASLDDELARGEGAYYARRVQRFPLRGSHEELSSVKIGRAQQQLLDEIRRVFDQQQTDYRVVVSPLYNQKRLAPEDLEALQVRFGRDRVFDFSGVNDFTRDRRNYYENSHYRPKVARAILARLYPRGYQPGNSMPTRAR